VTRQERGEGAGGELAPDGAPPPGAAKAGAGTAPAGAAVPQALAAPATSAHRIRGPGGASGDEPMPRVLLSRRQILAFGIFVLSCVGFLYFVLPNLAGVDSTVHHIAHGDRWWIVIGVLLEALSFGGYVVLFRTVLVRGQPRVGWGESYQITMAGLAATRLFAAAGAGGVALTAWALRRAGMEPRTVASRMLAFFVLLYVVYAGSLVIDGVGLGSGLFPGGGSFAITIVPAIVATVLFAIAGLMMLIPGDIERRLGARAHGSGRRARWLARAVTVPALASSGMRMAIGLVREREIGVLGAVAWWGFDMSVLWAMFHAFGSPPPFTVIWMAYFVGTLGNLLPLPGGLGGVEGGMIGAFAAFGVSLELAVVAVLSYRAISFWLPTFPGGLAYLQLRRTVSRWRQEEGESRAAGVLAAEPARALQGS